MMPFSYFFSLSSNHCCRTSTLWGAARELVCKSDPWSSFARSCLKPKSNLFCVWFFQLENKPMNSDNAQSDSSGHSSKKSKKMVNAMWLWQSARYSLKHLHNHSLNSHFTCIQSCYCSPHFTDGETDVGTLGNPANIRELVVVAQVFRLQPSSFQSLFSSQIEMDSNHPYPIIRLIFGLPRATLLLHTSAFTSPKWESVLPTMCLKTAYNKE